MKYAAYDLNQRAARRKERAQEAYGLFTELPVPVRVQVLSAPTYLVRLQIVMRYFPLTQALDIARICTPQTEPVTA
jgi:hypothetical protein